MATNKKALQRPGFLFLTSYYEAIKDFPDKEMRLAFLEAVIRFGAFGEEPDFSNNKDCVFLSALWMLTRPNLETSIKNYQNRIGKCKSRRDKDKDTDTDKDTDKATNSKRINNESGTNQNDSTKHNRRIDENDLL